MEIYEGNLKSDPPKIPKKFQVKGYVGISETQIKRNKKLELTKLELEIERLNEKTVKQDSILTNAECNTKKLIQQHEDPIERQKLIEKWKSDVTKEEKKSNDLWEKKKLFFQNDNENVTNHYQKKEKH